MFNRKLEKRIKELEDFLGIIYNTDKDGWADYYFRVTDYGDLKPSGTLGELKADLVKRQQAEKEKDEIHKKHSA